MDTIAILRTLVGFDTTSRLSNLPLVHWTVAYLEEHGARIRLSYDGDGGDGIDRTTFNVGRIDGGTAINIVPHRCEVVWEFRPSSGSDVGAIMTTVDDFMARSVVHNVKLDNAALTSVPPLASRNDNAALRLAHDLGAELPTLAMSFGTEAGFFQAAGIPTVVCRPGSIDQAHQPDEWITVALVEAGSRFLDRLGAWASTEVPL